MYLALFTHCSLLVPTLFTSLNPPLISATSGFFISLASISNNNINTFVEERGGTGQLVDAIKTTGYNDVVINNGTTGITVDLAGNNSETSSTDTPFKAKSHYATTGDDSISDDY